MRYFLSYKYTNNKNREDLKKVLEEISEKIESWGDEAFVLGRDVKKWKHMHLGTFKLIKAIFLNMKDCDQVYFYIDTPVFSKGMLFELMASKILNKRSVLFLKNDVNSKFVKRFVNKVVAIDSYHSISKQ